MGCHSSKVSATAEEIVAKRREIQSTTRWWKRLKSMRHCKTAPLPGTVECSPNSQTVDSDIFCVCRIESVELQLLSSRESSVEEVTDLLCPQIVGTPEALPCKSEKPNPSQMSDQPGRSTTKEDLILEDIEDFSRVQFWASPAGSETDLIQVKNIPEVSSVKAIVPNPVLSDIPQVMYPSTQGKHEANGHKTEEDLQLMDVDDNLSNRAQLCTDTSPPNINRELSDCPFARLPDVNKTALSNLSVPSVKGSLPNVFKLRRKKVRKASESSRDFRQENKSTSFSSKRSGAIEGRRVWRGPNLTEVHDMELPGVPQGNTKSEKSCLETWMKRRLEEEEGKK